jgi:PKD repeat protein
MANPSLDGVSASTYGDNNWNNFNDPHWWSGVQNHWFYILSVGDTATNNQGTPYSVAGIGMDDAHAIAYRNQSVYLVSSSQYDDARFYAIQSAVDLFGGCSPQHISCTNAWYAVELGNAFVATVNSNFTASGTALCSLDNSVFFTNLSINGQDYLWNFGDGNTSTDINPEHQYSAEGIYTVSLFTDGGTCGTDSIVQVDYITVALPPPPDVSDEMSVCENSSALLSGTATGTIQWYTTATGGNPIGSGNAFPTSPLSTTTTFYAENNVIPAVQSGGAPNNNFGSGSYFTNINSHYLVFDAYDNFTLQTVTVYSNATESRTIEMLNSAGDVIHTSTQIIANGTQVVPLNFTVTPGIGYRLGLQTGSNSDLYRNQTGGNYPYTTPGVLTITGNDVGPDYYYYFYNWQVQKAPCVSIRVPLTVTVLPSPVASFTSASTGSQFTFSNTSTGNSTSTTWNFGDGSTSTDSDPVHEYTTAGDYNVTLITCYNSCCDTFTQLISAVTGIPGFNIPDAVTVSPNPFAGFVQINYSSSNTASVKVELTDVLGQVLLSQVKNFLPGSQLITVNTSELAAGIYFIKVEANNTVRSFKVIRQM